MACDNLIQERNAIAHTAICVIGNHANGVIRNSQAFFSNNMGELLGNIVKRYAGKIELLAARLDCFWDFVCLSCS